MSSILYIGKGYCHTLEQLQEYFRHISSDQDALYNELLTLQRDGLIAQWLQEGSETEKMLAKRIMSLPTELANKELMENLAEILTNQNTLYNVNIFSYVELKEVSYALGVSCMKEMEYKQINQEEAIIIGEEHMDETLRLKMNFKVIKPEKEIFRLKATVSLNEAGIHEEVADLRLNNESIGEANVSYWDIPTIGLQKEERLYKLEVKNENQILFSTKVLFGVSRVFSSNVIFNDSKACFSVNGVQFEMIKVESGRLEMGSADNDSDAYDDEKPKHLVMLNEYYIGETVVTQALWESVMKENLSRFKGEDLPVEGVSYNDIKPFIRILNEDLKHLLHGKKFALPTEEQWEFAARGGKNSKGYKYSGSNDINEVAWYGDNSGNCTHPVKVNGKISNELGIYGMSGNVYEWCESCWRDNYNSNIGVSRRVIRGGSLNSCARYCRIANRNSEDPDNCMSNLGFRLILQ